MELRFNMKRTFFIILFTLFTLAINAGVEVMCDVIYKDKDGNWSDFYRTDSFLIGTIGFFKSVLYNLLSVRIR